MPALESRKLLMAALLASAVSAPAFASDEVKTAQQTVVGQAAVEVAAQPAGPSVVDQAYATENNGRVGTARPRPRVVELPPPQPVVRMPAAARVSYHRPALILGIGY